jgi:hypothetical protein
VIEKIVARRDRVEHIRDSRRGLIERHP